MTTKFQGDNETSDEDFVDPSIEKYFKSKTKKNLSKKISNGSSNSNEKIEKITKNGNGTSDSKLSQIKLSDKDFDYFDDDEDDDEEEPEDEQEETDDEKSNINEEQEDGDESNARRIKVTSQTLKNWSESLSTEKPFKAIREVVQAFKAALLNVIPNRKTSQLVYLVEGPDMFNEIVKLCMKDLLPAMLRVLDLTSINKKKKSQNEPRSNESSKFQLASSGSNWKKLKVSTKTYLEDMLSFATNISEADILNAILRHIRIMINFYMCFPKLLKSLIKLLITIWSQSDEKSRVISFICLHKIVSNTNEKNQDLIFKNLYLSFARNAKFTSINTLPLINFMQRSLIELYACNVKLAYEHVFVYIRQLAIHLRNAMTLKKKESFQAVYNWQYVHSLILWSKLLSTLANKNNGFNEYLHPLIYPLVQCFFGTVKLIPTPRYYPLRFHCINALIVLSNATDVFIPIIPFILEVFDITDFNKQHATISSKQVNFSFLLKLNKQQMQDKSFKDILIDIIYDNLILLLQHQSHDIAFPELVLPLVIRLKDFTKKCKNSNYCKVVKGLLDKIQENNKCIEERRNKATFSLRDKKQVDIWIEKNKEIGTPMSQWYSRYKTLREREILMEISNKDNISKNNVPVVERPTHEQKETEKREFNELFVDLSEDESDSELFDFMPKKKQKTEENGVKPMEEDDDEFDDEEDDFEEALKAKNKEKSDESDN